MCRWDSLAGNTSKLLDIRLHARAAGEGFIQLALSSNKLITDIHKVQRLVKTKVPGEVVKVEARLDSIPILPQT